MVSCPNPGSSGVIALPGTTSNPAALISDSRDCPSASFRAMLTGTGSAGRGSHMIDWWVLLGFCLGLGALIIGAEFLVRGASRLALALGISPLVIGLTIVAFGTSSPELAVSLKAGLAGQPDLALGNVVGSNIFNVLFILGVAALITPLTVDQKVVRVEVPLMIGTSLLLLAFSMNGSLGRLEGGFFFLGIVVYTVLIITRSRKESREIEAEYAEAFDRPVSSRRVQILWIAGGLALLVKGSDLLVDNSILIARSLGISELVIGLTLVSAGTSMPEVATSVVAAIRGERDIAVGNVVGSNLYNILAVLGLSAAAAPSGIAVQSAALWFDIPVMIAVSVACLPVFVTGARISRPEGGAFLAYYTIYVTLLYFRTTASDAASVMVWGLALFVVPLTLLGLILSYRTHRKALQR